MSLPSAATSLTESSNASKELCVVCQNQPYDLVCSCGDKFDFTCIHSHVEQIGIEFQYLQVQVGQRLLQAEQIVEDNSCENVKTIVENWKRKRMQDINDIADEFLHQMEKHEKTYSDVAPFRLQYNTLCQETDRIVHEQLNAMIELQREIYNKSEQLEQLPPLLLQDDIDLDTKLQSKLNPNISQYNSSSHQTESVNSPSTPIITTTTTTAPNTESITSVSNANELTNSEPTTPSNEVTAIGIEVTTSSSKTDSNDRFSISSQPAVTTSTTTTLAENSTTRPEPSPEVPLTNNNNTSNLTAASIDQDEFEAGLTANIHRQNPITIPINNDRYAATVCCHENQLIYNDFQQRSRTFRLTLIPDIRQITDKRIIDWEQPEPIIGGGDDNWIQDISYSTKLQAYLLLNRSRLRILHKNTNQLEEFHQFPDRSLKRVTCDGTYIYLISAAGVTGPNGDEIILMNYDKEETLCKTYRDIAPQKANRTPGPIPGEISDIAVSNHGQLLLAYRLERRQEIGVYLYNITNNGNDWTHTKQLLLNDCWHNDLSYTPRLEWNDKLNVFILIEYVTGHLIMLDANGQVRGETRFANVNNRQESALNLSISNNNWLCVRYETSINIHRVDDNRL